MVEGCLRVNFTYQILMLFGAQQATTRFGRSRLLFLVTRSWASYALIGCRDQSANYFFQSYPTDQLFIIDQSKIEFKHIDNESLIFEELRKTYLSSIHFLYLKTISELICYLIPSDYPRAETKRFPYQHQFNIKKLNHKLNFNLKFQFLWKS